MTRAQKHWQFNLKKYEWWDSGGFLAPTFEGSEVEQELFSVSGYEEDANGVFVKDKSNTGDSRDPLQGKARNFDGVDDKISFGSVGNIRFISLLVRLVTDDQMILSLQDSAATAISVAAGTLTFGGSLTVNNIYVDNVLETAADAGTILNDNVIHHLMIDIDSITASDLVLGAESTTFGNIQATDFRVFVDILTSDERTSIFKGDTIGDELHWWKLDENLASAKAIDSNGNDPNDARFFDNGTVTGTTFVRQDIISYHNELGYLTSDGSTYYYDAAATELIPIDTLIPALNATKAAAYITGGARADLEFTGKVPLNGQLVESHCLTFDGVDDKISFADLSGITITSSEGTATPSINGNDIECTAGTLFNLVLSNGAKFALAEGDGLKAFDNSGNGFHGDLVGGVSWTATQDDFHYNQRNGFNTYDNAGTKIKVPRGIDAATLFGWTLDSEHPAGAYHNGAETKFKPNWAGAPSLIRANGIDENSTRGYNGQYLNPEFINWATDFKLKNYVVYSDILVIADEEKVWDVMAIKYPKNVATDAEQRLWMMMTENSIEKDANDLISKAVERFNGFDFTEATDKPQWTDPDTAEGDGVDDKLVNSVDHGNLVADDQGEIILVMAPVGTGSAAGTLALANNSVDNSFFVTGINHAIATNHRILQQSRGAANNVLYGSTNLTAGTYYVLRINSDNITVKLFVDGVEETVNVQSGSNAGHWMDYPAGIDNMALFSLQRLSELFYNLKLKGLYVLGGRTLTDTEYENLEKFFNYTLKNSN